MYIPALISQSSKNNFFTLRIDMKKKTIFSLLAIPFFLFSESYVANAEGYYECGVFSKYDYRSEREYRDCFSCLRDNDRCEERCWQEGYRCEATGTYGFRREKITGPSAATSRQAEQWALSRCYDEGLHDCYISYCSRDEEIDPRSVRSCDQYSRREQEYPPRYDSGSRHEHSPRPAPGYPPKYDSGSKQERNQKPAPKKKVVVSWQHVKGECFAKPYPKISEQCGNRANYWQGIYCVVQWSDGSTSEVHGKVDLKDAAGNSYCTRSTRPAQFNCVNRCDNNNGPVSRP